MAHPSVTPAKELARAAELSQGADVHDHDLRHAPSARGAAGADWGLVVLDEAQAIRNPSAKQTRAVKELKSRGRLALTGTPVENRLGDLWSLFDFLQPGLLGSAKAAFSAFTKGRSESVAPDWGPLRRLVRPFILQRLKTDRSVIADLPEKTEMKVTAAPSRRRRRPSTSRPFASSRSFESVDGMKRRGLVLSYLMRFKQLCNHLRSGCATERSTPPGAASSSGSGLSPRRSPRDRKRPSCSRSSRR